MMNVFAKNRTVAYKTAAKKTGLTYEEVKAAYKKPADEKTDVEKRASKIVYAILKSYAEKYHAANAENAEAVEAAPAEATAEAVVSE